MLYWEFGPLDSKARNGVAGPPQSKSTRDEAGTASSESQMDSVSEKNMTWRHRKILWREG